MDRITVEELIGLIEAGKTPIILDVRAAEARGQRRHHSRRAGGPSGRYPPAAEGNPPETEIVVYCACPNEASAAIAARHLKRAGFKKIRPLLGGVEAWVGAGRHLA